jgi:hypothetical protein
VSENKEAIKGFIGLEQQTEDAAMHTLMLMKLKMTNAEYFENKPAIHKRSSVQGAFQNLYSSLFKSSHTYRPFKLNTEIA